MLGGSSSSRAIVMGQWSLSRTDERTCHSKLGEIEGEARERSMAVSDWCPMRVGEPSFKSFECLNNCEKSNY